MTLRLGGVPDLGGVVDLPPLAVRRGDSARACSILAASPARVIRGGVDDRVRGAPPKPGSAVTDLAVSAPGLGEPPAGRAAAEIFCATSCFVAGP